MSKKKYILFLLYLYFFSFRLIGQDSIPLFINAWKVINIDSVKVSVDTLIDKNQIIQLYRGAHSSNNLGHNGLPMRSNHIKDFLPFSEVFSLDYNYPYILYPEKIVFYNTTIPITYLKYFGAKRKSIIDQSIEILHTQNVNKDFNIGMLFNSVSYENKLSQDNNYQNDRDVCMGLNMNYHSVKYKNHIVLTYNNLRQRENGGELLDTLRDYDADTKTRIICFEMIHGINLANINNPDTFEYLKDSLKGTYLMQRIKITDLKRLYIDELRDKTLYPGINLLNNAIRDSALFTKIKNQFILDFNRNNDFPFKSQLFLSSEYQRYKSMYQDTLIEFTSNPILNPFTKFKHIISNSLGVNFIITKYKKLKIETNAEYWMNSYFKNDFYIDSKFNYRISDSITSPIFTFYFKTERIQSPWFINQYASSYLVWNRILDPSSIKTSEINFDIPKAHLKFTGGFKLINKMIFFNENSVPDQISANTGLYYASIYNKFKFWHFYIINDYTFQYTSSNSFYRVPSHILYNSSYLEKDVRFFTGGKIFLQAGFDLRYHTAFFANAYKQSIGSFYIQNHKKYGDYPMLDLYLKMKIKEAGLYFKIENLMNLINSDNVYYTPNYIYSEWLLRIGISWTFKY